MISFPTTSQTKAASINVYIFELSDISYMMFFIKSIKCPTNSFNIFNFISFSNSPRSRGLKLHHNPSNTNKQRHFYFVRICRLWNALPLIDVTLSIQTIKNKIKSHFWDHFTCFFDPLDPYKLHYLCPCSQCVSTQFLSTIQNLDSNSHILFM